MLDHNVQEVKEIISSLIDNHGDEVIFEAIEQALNEHEATKHYDPRKEWAVLGVPQNIDYDRLFAAAEVMMAEQAKIAS